MVASVVIVIDKCAYLPFKIPRQVVILKEHAVFHCLMPSLNLSLGLWVMWRPTNMIHPLGVEVISEFCGDI